MNIQQQQAALSALPTDQTAIPILQRIAQGQHPMFPPGTEWMGLAKMNEVKRSMEAAQAMQQAAMAGQQAPTVRDQVQQGVASLAQQQMQTQQGQMAMAAQQAPQRMAAGGIARYVEGGAPEQDGPSELRLLIPAALAGSASAMSQLNALAPGLGYKTGGELLRAMAGTAIKDTKMPGLPKSALGKAGVAGLLAGTAAEVAGTDTEAYRKRFGMETDDPSFAGDLAARALGAASDLGNMATFGYAEKFFRDKQKPQPSTEKPQPSTEKPPVKQDNTPRGPTKESVGKGGPRAPASDVGIATLPAPAPRSVGDYPTYTPELPEDPTVARKALMAGEPALQGDPMADRKAYAEKMAQREAALRARFAEADPQMQREAWTRKLLAAANAAGSQGGMRGIASALGGFAEQSAREGQYERKVASERIGQQEKLEDLRIQFEMETRAAERAAAEGRITEALKHRENVAKIKEEARKLAYQGQVDKYKLDRESEDRRLDREGRLEQQRLANQGSLASATARTSGSEKREQVAELRLAAQTLQKQIDDSQLSPNKAVRDAVPQMRAQLQAVNAAILKLSGIESGDASKPAASPVAMTQSAAEALVQRNLPK